MLYEVITGMVEADAQQAVDAQARQGQVFLPQPGESGRGLMLNEQLQRLGLEQHDAGRHPQGMGLVLELLQHRLVAQVHTVKIPDGQHTTGMFRAQIMKTADS